MGVSATTAVVFQMHAGEMSQNAASKMQPKQICVDPHRITVLTRAAAQLWHLQYIDRYLLPAPGLRQAVDIDQ